jgi:6-phosphogluconolactonase (cycloisomerase 2 family)
MEPAMALPIAHRYLRFSTPPNMISPNISRRSFLKASAALAGGSLLAPWPRAHAASGKPLIAYVGTYSSPLPIIRPGQVDLPPGNGKGIHSFLVDRATGALSPHTVVEMATSPSCVALNAAGTHLYSANETAQLAENDAGTVSAFAIDPADGKLTLLNTVSSGGAGPTNISIHPSGKFALVANYFGGSVVVLPILPDGKIGERTDFKQDAGTVGPKQAKNAPLGSFAISGHDLPHAHQIKADPSGRFVLAPDLGLDEIVVWKFDDKAGTLSPNDPPTVPFPPGDGPRHFDFHPNGRWLYSLQEEGSNIVLFDYDAEKGRLTPRQTLSSLPTNFAGSNFCSEIAVSSDGRFVYAANRLHDTIAWFAIGKTGTLTFVAEEWTRGDYPRSFNFDPTGNFLYCCNQRADHLTTFHVDKKKGTLTFTGKYTPVGNPSMLTFLDLAKVQRG